MTLAATYNDDLGRIQLVVTGAPADADYALFERSTDNITWTQVRGGQTVGLTAGGCKLDDYEFAAGVSNYYRATYVDTAPTTYIGSGGPVSGVNSTLTPFTNGSTQAGDLVLLLATIRNSGAGAPDTPAGWTPLVDMWNMKVFARYATTGGSTGQTVTFSNGVAGADVTAQMATFRNAGINIRSLPVLWNNSAAQNIAWPGGTPPVAGTQAVLVGWKQSGWTSAPVPSYSLTAELGQVSATAGDDAGHVWWTHTKSSTSPMAPGTWSVSGGSSTISKSALFFLAPRDFVSRDTATAVPSMNDVWLKNVLRPNLNRKVSPVNRVEVSRESRSSVFNVAGRTMPVAVTDVRGGREFNLPLFVGSYAERDELDNVLATGDTLYLHVPAGNPITSAYVLVGGTTWSDVTGLYQLPCTEVAAPDGTLVGETILWLDVTNEYPTWADVISAEPTWSDLLSQIAQGGSVIVP